MEKLAASPTWRRHRVHQAQLRLTLEHGDALLVFHALSGLLDRIRIVRERPPFGW